MTCINCGNSAVENFCPNCGQRTSVKRITFREGWNDFWSRVYGFDGMFPRTLRDLTIRPGVVARKYIECNRVLYYGPVGYFFLMVTVYLLFMSMIGVDVKDFMGESQKMYTPLQSGEGQQRFSQFVLEWVSDNMRIISFIVMPFNALVAHYLLFRKNQLNYLEQMVLPFYVSGHLMWVNMVTVGIYRFSGSMVFSIPSMIISFLYFGLAYSQFINYQPKWKSFLKGGFVQVLGLLFMVLTVILIVIIFILLLPYFSPETYELIRPSNNR